MYGFTNCYPCVPCQRGKYREAGSRSEVCNYCNKNCSVVFRYESMPCGGSSPGHCGQCFTGREPEDEMPESFCKEPVGKTTAPSTTKELVGRTTTSLNEASDVPKKSIDSAGVAIIMCTAVLICVAFGAGIYHFRKDICRRCNCVSEGDYFGSQESKRPLKSDCSLEIDGPNSPCPELESHPVDFGPPALEQIRTYMPDFKLDVESESTKKCLIIVSTKASNEHKRNTIFVYLRIEKAVYEPEEERWLKEKQSYPEFVYMVLKTWVQRDHHPTFLKLYDAVRKADIGIAEELLESVHIQYPVEEGRISSERDAERELVPYTGIPILSRSTFQFTSIEIPAPSTGSTGSDAQYVSSDESLVLKTPNTS
ncbi:hypothetical protein MAR_008301 [Mya arenaria]|uniref:TNFR-Cys domain-containing protein n=2 Tax=Mya arenaria TaxID=6604 RepID=A0ABY7DVL7_MYAAR|nr:uncharacterized protein LOC128231639 isoform X2 [Mya arenaria]WAR01743.1 hypothetical protein MAR_008301 [Mya arenaria]